MSCLLFILSSVQNFSIGTCILLWYDIEKNILLVNGRVLWESVALCGIGVGITFT